MMLQTDDPEPGPQAKKTKASNVIARLAQLLRITKQSQIKNLDCRAPQKLKTGLFKETGLGFAPLTVTK